MFPAPYSKSLATKVAQERAKTASLPPPRTPFTVEVSMSEKRKLPAAPKREQEKMPSQTEEVKPEVCRFLKLHSRCHNFLRFRPSKRLERRARDGNSKNVKRLYFKISQVKEDNLIKESNQAEPEPEEPRAPLSEADDDLTYLLKKGGRFYDDNDLASAIEIYTYGIKMHPKHGKCKAVHISMHTWALGGGGLDSGGQRARG